MLFVFTALFVGSAASLSRLHHAVGDGSLPIRGVGLGVYSGGAGTLRTAASMVLAFLSPTMRPKLPSFLRMPPESTDPGVVDLKVKRKRNDQFGPGQLPPLLAVKTWEGACPVRHFSGRLWFRSWAHVRSRAGCP